MLVGGVIGAALFDASTISAAAATPSPTPTASAAPFKGNEDPTHEQGETAARKAAEAAGTAFPGGPHAGGPAGGTERGPGARAG